MTRKFFFCAALGLALVGALQLAEATPAASLNVLDFGAKGDGQTKDTAAIQKALDACAAAGGGEVIVPNGVFLTGSIVIGANTTLQLEPKADLVGSPGRANFARAIGRLSRRKMRPASASPGRARFSARR